MTEALSPAQQFILGSITRRLAEVDRPTVRKPLTEVLYPQPETPLATPEETPRTETPPRPARARPQKRRNYAKELSDLQSKVDMAIRLLRKAEESKSGPDMLANWALVSVALETLSEE